jgi:hypothetical protein
MRGRWGVWLAAAGLLVVMGGGALAQSKPPESAEQNVKESQQYEALLCSNPGFRAKRIAQECGPLQGSQFYDSCVHSFDCNRPARATHPRKAPPSVTTR